MHLTDENNDKVSKNQFRNKQASKKGYIIGNRYIMAQYNIYE